MINKTLGVGVLLFLLLLEFPLLTNANDFTLQELIDKASEGDVIQLEDRVYKGDIIIDKQVALKGSGKTTIVGSGQGDVITLIANGVVIENLEITGSGMNLDKDQAAIKMMSNHNQIIGNEINQSLFGIYLTESSGNVIKKNTIEGNLDFIRGRRGNGIHLFHSSKNIIEDNKISNVRDGIYFSFSEENQIDHNQVSNNRYGLHYMYSDNNSFYQNSFFENIGGAAIMFSNFIELKENSFRDHLDIQSFGILLQSSNDILLENNDIQFNQKGIFMDQSNRNTLRGNLITNNRIGLAIWSSAKDNLFTENQVLNNNLPFSSNNGEDQNQWSENGVGNQWSRQTNLDLNQDGIGDHPFTFSSSFGKVLSEQQLGVLFLDSPALAIYEKWNQVFSSHEKSLIDPYPIIGEKSSTSYYFLPFYLLIGLSLWWVYRKWWKMV